MHKIKITVRFWQSKKRLQLKELAVSRQWEQVSYESCTEMQKRKHLMAKLVNKIYMCVCVYVCMWKQLL